MRLGGFDDAPLDRLDALAWSEHALRRGAPQPPRRPSHNWLDWKDRDCLCCRRDQARRPSRGVPGWIPLRGPACRPSGRSPPGSRKNCHSTYGPPPFSGLARVADGGDVTQGKRSPPSLAPWIAAEIVLSRRHRAAYSCSPSPENRELVGHRSVGLAEVIAAGGSTPPHPRRRPPRRHRRPARRR